MIEGILAALIIGSLTIGLHAAPQRVPLYPDVDAPFTGDAPLLVCRGELSSVVDPDVYRKVQKHVLPLGINVLDPVEIDCNHLCQYGDRFAPCENGAIVVSIRDQEFSEDHQGETLLLVRDGRVLCGSILLPEKIYYTGVPDTYAKVLAHEIMTWAGYQHVWTPIVPGIHGVPTGHLMNPSLSKLGWSTRGMEHFEKK